MFPGKTLVLSGTESGFRRIDRVRPGDLVVTHRGELRKVLGVRAADPGRAVVRFRVGEWFEGGAGDRFLVDRDDAVRWCTVPQARPQDRFLVWEVEKKKPGSIKLTNDARLVTDRLEGTSAEKRYALEVEEEHSFGVVAYDGKLVLFAKG